MRNTTSLPDFQSRQKERDEYIRIKKQDLAGLHANHGRVPGQR